MFDFHISVLITVPPLIRIQNQLVGAANGTTAVLECDVEAYPESVRYWERADGKFIENGYKYRTNDTEKGKYKVRMQLNITNIGINDFGLYHCISKNEIGMTKGIFTVFGEFFKLHLLPRQVWTSPDRFGQVRTGQITGPDKSGQVRTGQSTGPDKSRQIRTGRDKSGP